MATVRFWFLTGKQWRFHVGLRGFGLFSACCPGQWVEALMILRVAVEISLALGGDPDHLSRSKLGFLPKEETIRSHSGSGACQRASLETGLPVHGVVAWGFSHPCCNSRSSPTFPSPLERKHEGPAHIQSSPVSSS